MVAGGAVRQILIVGGGTAGWMAAALLKRMLRPAGCRVTLIESAEVGTIGVGEATVPPLVEFVRAMKLDERELMRRCHATYKLGIKFIDWHRPGHVYWHPFGLCGGHIDGMDLFHFWLRRTLAGGDVGPYSGYSVQARLGDAGKAPRPRNGSSPVIDSGAYAYHIDATALADTLRRLATGEGVTHLVDTVRHVAADAGGAITHIDTEAGRRLKADLYVDCSGFAGRLIEQALGDPWIDWSDTLLCDRAVVAPLAADGRFLPYTCSTAMSAGWMWRIPLGHRIGCGYVYSSRHLSDDAAVEEMRASAGESPVEPRRLAMRVGRRSAFWRGNCVAVGLASGFVEPLESTGIYLIQRSLELLLDYLPDRDFNPVLRRAYNARMAAIYEEVRDFILLHYLLSTRDTDAFWRDSRRVAVPDSLAQTIALHDECGKVEPNRVALFQEPSLHFLFTGNQRLPRRALVAAEIAPIPRIDQVLGEMRAQNRRLIDSLPPHAELMTALHASPG